MNENITLLLDWVQSREATAFDHQLQINRLNAIKKHHEETVDGYRKELARLNKELSDLKAQPSEKVKGAK